jgi:hypothetical protein
VYELFGAADAPSLLAWLVLVLAAGMYPVGIMLGAPCSACCGFQRCLRFEAVTPPDPNNREVEGNNGFNYNAMPPAGFSKVVGSLEEVGVNEGPTGQNVIDEWFVPFPNWSTRVVSGIVFSETDPEQVAQFLAGDISLTGTVNTTQEEWTVRVEEPTDFCGVSIHSALEYLIGMGVVDDAIEWNPGPTCECEAVAPAAGVTASLDGTSLQTEVGQVSPGRFGVVAINDSAVDFTNLLHNTPVSIAFAGGNVARQPTARVEWVRAQPTITASVGGGSGAVLTVSVAKRHTAPQTWKVSGVSVSPASQSDIRQPDGGYGFDYEWGTQVTFSTSDTVSFMYDGFESPAPAIAFARTVIKQPQLALAVESANGSGASVSINWDARQITWPLNTPAGKYPLSDTFHVPLQVSIDNAGTGYAVNDPVVITEQSLSPQDGTIRLLKWWPSNDYNQELYYGGFTAKVADVGESGEILAVSVPRTGYYFHDTGAVKDVQFAQAVYRQFGNLEDSSGSYYGTEERVITITDPGSAYDIQSEQAPDCTGPSPEDIPLLLLGDYLGVWYRGAFQTCAFDYLSAILGGNDGFQVAPEAFFCGDALWAIENGTCRSSFKPRNEEYFYGLYEHGTVSLSGNKGAGLRFNGDYLCNYGGEIPVYRDWHGGNSCAPPQATVTLEDDVEYASTTLGGCGPEPALEGAKLASGDYVLDGGGSCNSWGYSGLFPIADGAEGKTDSGTFDVGITVSRSRGSWCLEWDEAVLLTEGGFTPGGFCGTGIIYPTRLDEDGNVQVGQPEWVNDSAVEYGDEEDPTVFSITQSTDTMPAEGGTYTVTTCCPEQEIEVTVTPNTEKYPRGVVESVLGVGLFGARAIITQEALDDEQ